MTSRTEILRPRPLRTYAAAGALFALACVMGGPAATQDQPLSGQSADEIERFCGTIVDAARERRYALQRQELETLEKQINERIEVLEQRRQEYEAWLDRRNEFLRQAQDSLVDIYGRMRPDAAAVQLGELRTELAASIIMKLDTRKASVILNEMDAKAAAGLTSLMARAASREDPS